MSTGANLSKPDVQRSRPSFLARVATDDAAQLGWRPAVYQRARGLLQGTPSTNSQDDRQRADSNVPGTSTTRPRLPGWRAGSGNVAERESRGPRLEDHRALPPERRPLLGDVGRQNRTSSRSSGIGRRRDATPSVKEKLLPDASEGPSKLGTFSGVFVPTSLNVLSILMFLRFGFILGQSGVLGMLAMLVICYLINLVTTLSISAIATNGTVRGGGAYYLISRSLGPEFGGSIGIVFYLGFVLNTGMNAVGLVDCFVQSFGVESGSWQNWLPEGFWWTYLWATAILVFCTLICLAGSGVFARASNGLLVLLLLSTISIPLSALVMKPFESRRLGIQFTGLSLQTFKGNLMPRFTKGAAGSQLGKQENFQDLFGILFPATGGIFAGASMSGDLKHPSKAIPKGTLSGLALTFVLYVIVILSMAATITRASLYRNANVIQDTNLSATLILLGEFATTFFSALMGVIGSAKLLQALARDSLLPGLTMFSQGTKKSDEPVLAILVTLLVAQLTIFFDINQIASFVTMTYLMTFLVTNLACFLLEISSAPNFRPSFHYFNWETAAAGTIVSGVTIFFVDGLYASGCVGILIVLFLLIHYLTPPKSWGDVSQSLIYHQVRKYLLRLRQEHVKYWRPQILLFINDPRNQLQLVKFCNHLKKGGLFVLGHVIVSEDFAAEVQEIRKQQSAWTKYIEVAKVKAFVSTAVAPTVEWGVRNIVLSSGLGGMRPNIAVLGFYNLKITGKTAKAAEASRKHGSQGLQKAETDGDASDVDIVQANSGRSGRGRVKMPLPTDICKVEATMSVTSYVTILEDLLLRLRINVAMARGFTDLELHLETDKSNKRYIDLWPIQMSAEIFSDNLNGSSFLTTNFDTYTLILQLGCILNTVPSWKSSYKLRVAVFVEYECDVEEERERVRSLLETLRIEAEVLVFWLACGSLRYYEIFVNGVQPSTEERYELHAKDFSPHLEDWSHGDSPGREGDVHGREQSPNQERRKPAGPSARESLLRHKSDQSDSSGHLNGLMLGRRRHTMSGISRLGVSLGMRTHRLNVDLIEEDDESSAGDESDVFSDPDENDLFGQSFTDIRASRSSDDLRRGDAPARQSPPGPSSGEGPAGRASESNLHQPVTPDKTLVSSPTFAAPSARPDRSSLERSGSDPQSDAPVEEAAEPIRRKPAPSREPEDEPSPARPSTDRTSSMGKFTSDPVPRTEVAPRETPGTSIMFANSPPPPSALLSSSSVMASDRGAAGRRSIYRPNKAPPATSSSAQPQLSASGYPSPRAQPLSFNDLPCRPQHLILNELIRQQSRHTAVIFTTLPSPLKGTCETESDSLRYLSDLDILCRDLPPTLLIHSNSMTVTTNL